MTDEQLSVFILETVWHSFGYSYECVSEEEWNETFFSVCHRTDDPLERLEQQIITTVVDQAWNNGWLEWLKHNIPQEEEACHE